MIRWGFDEPDTAAVVGEVTPYSAQLFYGGRPQGQKISGKSISALHQQLLHRRKQLLAENAGICYDTGEVWEIREWGTA